MAAKDTFNSAKDHYLSYPQNLFSTANTIFSLCGLMMHISSQVSGTTERPRLSVFRSNKHLYAQVIDDTKQCTLASASTMHKSLSKELEYSAGPTIVSYQYLLFCLRNSDLD
jgi:hypothetical protein